MEKGKTFDNNEVLRPGEYEDCTFKRCTTIFDGVVEWSFKGCAFEKGHVWAFSGPAASTLQFLAATFDAGNKALINAIIDDIRLNRVGRRIH